jgi:hypothetical protein
VDRGSLLRVWAPLLLGLYAIYLVFVMQPGPHDSTCWIGFALSLLGLAGVVLARYTLGQSFSVKAKATELATTGIYSRIRNPIYVFGVILLAGLILIGPASPFRRGTGNCYSVADRPHTARSAGAGREVRRGLWPLPRTNVVLSLRTGSITS